MSNLGSQRTLAAKRPDDSYAVGFSDATRGGRVARGAFWRPRSAHARNRGFGVRLTGWVYGDLKRWIALGSAGHAVLTDLVWRPLIEKSPAFSRSPCSTRLSSSVV